MNDVWDRIHGWLARHAPEMLDRLAPPATSQQIAAAEATLGVTFPAAYRESLLIHDGQRSSSVGLLTGWDLLPLSKVVRTRKMWDDFLRDGTFLSAEDPRIVTLGTVRSRWCSSRWIPIAGDGAGDAYVLDLDPAPGGHSGQIVVYLHNAFERMVIAPGLRTLLCDFADGLENGDYCATYEDGHLTGVEPIADGGGRPFGM